MSYGEQARKRKSGVTAVGTSKSARATSSPRFTVTYSHLCDGGAQEMSTAVTCVREIFPNAAISTSRRRPEEDRGNPNPSVVISLDSDEVSLNSSHSIICDKDCLSDKEQKDINGMNILWSTQQRNLYEKYPKKRRRSMNNIRKTLEAFKSSMSPQGTLDDSKKKALAGTSEASTRKLTTDKHSRVTSPMIRNCEEKRTNEKLLQALPGATEEESGKSPSKDNVGTT